MWRSFFLAVGIFAIILGLETMVVDQVIMTNVRRIPKIVSVTARNLVTPEGTPGIQNQPQVPPSPSPYQMPTFNRPSAAGSAASGPTGYRGTQSGTFNRVLSPTVLNRSSQRPRLGFAGYQNKGTDAMAPIAAVRAQPSKIRRPRIIRTADWMPWSLLAAGAIIVLYTQSFGRNDD